ncbi:hypothetical protein DPMN_158909 [Dreissena polymorpha]|uniref:Uncharacterized protein n=1 Tax=Dreissena polymorpha TaxID=45954 RepID=A0A9D4IQ83_DREPO|nr:hypothetical protein DPMN_158909 [Dreissena polymorpha]
MKFDNAVSCRRCNKGTWERPHMVALKTKSEGHKGHKPTENTEDLAQEQMLMKKKRPEEASKEMLYRVYGNVIAMLEEYERRQDGKQMPKSKIDISDQSWKNDKDVQANVESQLVVFEAQLKACPPKVSSELKKELRISTIEWAATRAERMTDRFSDSDMYISQVFEILVDGRTHHQIFDEKREKLSRETANNTMSAFFAGKHTASQIDKKYESDPSQKASPPQIRTTSGDFELHSGAERIRHFKPHLSFALDDDVCLATGSVQ